MMALPAAAFGQLAFETTQAEKKVDASEDTLEVQFPFANKQERPVVITKIDSSCGCLKASADLVELPPGGKGIVTGVFSVGVRTGDYDKTLTVFTESGGEERTQNLRVRVNVPPLAKILPQLLHWEVGSEPETKSYIYEVLREDPIRIEKASASREGFDCEIEELEEGRKYRIKLTPGSTDSPMMGIVRIETDCEIEKHRRQLAFFSIKRAPAK